MIYNGQEVVLIADGSQGEDDVTTPETLDFAEMRRNGICGFWTRATIGIREDPSYKIFRANCYAAGMPFGAFGTLHPGYDPTRQAEKFISVVEANRKPELSHMMDWEMAGATWQMADTWLAKVEQRYPGWEIINYSRSEYLRQVLPNRFLNPTKYARFAKIPVWQAHYYVKFPEALPVGFTRVLWQFTGKGDRAAYSSTGESKELDLNYFFGTETEFRTRFGLNPVVEPPVVTGPPSSGIASVTVTTAVTYPDGHTDTVVVTKP